MNADTTGPPTSTSGAMADAVALLSTWGLAPDVLRSGWRQAPARGRASLPSSLIPDEMPGGDVTTLLLGGLRSDMVALTSGGRLVHPIEYTRAEVIADRPVPNLVDAEQVKQLVADGATAMLANAEVWMPSVARTAATLAAASGCEVQGHVFWTGAGRAGLVPHADGEDNFLLQILGEKSWSLWSRPPAGPSHVEAATLGPADSTVTLRPGDVLYIPLGWVHTATAGPLGSTHITYQVVPDRLLERVLNQLAEALGAEFGEPMTDFAAAPPLAEEDVARIVQAVADALRLPH